MLSGLRERERLREDVRRQAEELRASRTRVVAASDAARRRIERDLHDGAQQRLVMLALKLRLAERRLAEDPDAAPAVFQELRDDLQRALSELRDLAHGIYPTVLESEGLPAALEDAISRCAIPARLECNGVGRHPRELEAAVYFCCLEALQNAGKHAGAGASASVWLAEADGELQFGVSDDGRGCDPLTVDGSAGLQNMADRIGALGGTLTIDSARGRGTRVHGRVPLRAEAGRQRDALGS